MIKLALLLTAAAATSAGPTTMQFNALIHTRCHTEPVVRNVQCTAVAGQAGQFHCRYQLSAGEEGMVNAEATVARHGAAWTWVQGPTVCDEATDPSLN